MPPFTGELTDERKQKIASMTLEQMLRAWRFGETGSFRTNDPVTEFFIKLMTERREANPGEWVRASKNIGW